jgi:AcrR family transcriptional regulator
VARRTTTEPERGPVYEPGRVTADAVFEAAERLFSQSGFERTTMRTVAAEAGVTVGSVYQFFDDKQAILDRISAQCLDLVDAVFTDARSLLGAHSTTTSAAVGSPGPAVTTTVSAIVEGLVRAAADRPMFRTLLVGSATDGPLHVASATVSARVEDRIEELLRSSRHHRSPARVRRTALVCNLTIRGLIGSVVTPERTIDRTLLAELETVLSLYVFHTKSRT